MEIEKRKNEAVDRLKILVGQGLMKNVLTEFKNEDTLYYSDRCSFGGDPFGCLYWFEEDNSVNPEWIKKVNDAIEKYNLLVYHITHEMINGEDMLDLFYVSDNEEEWEYDRLDLGSKVTMAYVLNLANSDYSEFGYIGYNVSGGGLIREP